MDQPTRSLLYRQIKDALVHAPPCADGGPTRACQSCEAELITTLVEPLIDAARLAR